jgi:hypothetical protein
LPFKYLSTNFLVSIETFFDHFKVTIFAHSDQ